MPFTHQLRIRYGECDMQGVVFNAHYLAYVDDAMTSWMGTLDKPYTELGWDCMVVRAELDWRGSARFNEILDIDCSVVRWGNTSFVVGYDLHVGGRPVCRVELTYIGVVHNTTDKMAPPDEFKRALEAAAA